MASKEIHSGKRSEDSKWKFHWTPPCQHHQQSPQNYESKNAELEVTPETVDIEIIEISNSDSEEGIQNFYLCECVL